MNPALADFILARTPQHVLDAVRGVAGGKHDSESESGRKQGGGDWGQVALTLNTGAKIPVVGLGTWQSAPGQVHAAVLHALQAGYRHIDAAHVYQNELEVGTAIAEALATGILTRSELFVTSKLWCTAHRTPAAALETTLANLGLEYLDLYLVHWPVPMNAKGNHALIPKLEDGSRDLDREWSHVDTWREMERLLADGRTRAVGVSNYSKRFLEEVLERCEIVPAVNQVENHPYLPQEELVRFCAEKGIVVEAYSPLGSTGGPLLTEDAVVEVAAKYGVGAGAVLVSYQVMRGLVVLPKSVTPERIEANLAMVELDQGDLEKLDRIHRDQGTTRYVYPDFGVDLGFPDKQ